ncbi:hypothetical protein VDF13_01215 [Xanthomonas campestris pv. raphani]|uniref:hypothetical protein n=1 Tax=Xanthomonas campestris TaxID=339 RepID=UPI001E44D537|nr:hypothetical protein [Xanthomonas campestris]MCC8484892.1 hypothetical protein [Xanthomonas campestris]MEA9648812.1 hypothetical protein [Xanthomonas campestris pv. raphani]MEA9741554.1 hypothetical protein [Xanthomonas campestris pv. raphani]MEA9765914.1 hypothetical protein [Xanthomonas campestris pv. raphani]MEA9866765.1 hypothetical protein [Xanthomonas campestris pv. raphani]
MTTAPPVRQLKIFLPALPLPASHKHKCANFLRRFVLHAVWHTRTDGVAGVGSRHRQWQYDDYFFTERTPTPHDWLTPEFRRDEKRPRTFDQQTDRPHVAHRPTITRDGCDSDDSDRSTAAPRADALHLRMHRRQLENDGMQFCARSANHRPPGKKNGRSDERPSGCGRRRDQCASSSSSSA